jgi:hypothetical protein
MVTESEIILWDTSGALTVLGKRLKVWTERVEVETPQAEAYRLLLKQREGKE